MIENRYLIYFSGKTHPHMDADTVKGNLVLYLNISEEKANRLFKGGAVLLKRCATLTEAQLLAEKFDRAGAICSIQDSRQSDVMANQKGSEESSLVRLLKSFTPGVKREGGSWMNKMKKPFSSSK